MIGEKIQQLRKAHQLSQEQLAEKLSVSRQAISKWELGESIPETDKIVLISDLFKVSTDYLFKEQWTDPTSETTESYDKGKSSKWNNLAPTIVVVMMTGVSAIGLLVSLVAENFFLNHDNMFLLGSIVQILALIGFEILVYPKPKTDIIKTRRWFYVINTWLILPFYSLIVSMYVLMLSGWNGYSVLYHWMVRGIIYAVMGIVFSIILLIVLRTPKKKPE